MDSPLGPGFEAAGRGPGEALRDRAAVGFGDRWVWRSLLSAPLVFLSFGHFIFVSCYFVSSFFFFFVFFPRRFRLDSPSHVF